MPEEINARRADGALIGINGSCSQSTGKPETLISATFAPPCEIDLKFADGKAIRSSFTKLEINPASLLLHTMKATATGNALEVMCSDGEVIRIDSTALRSMIDADFAAEFERKLTAMRGPLNELLDAAPRHAPPQEWWDEKVAIAE